MPRHPPCALNSLTTNIQCSWISALQAVLRSSFPSHTDLHLCGIPFRRCHLHAATKLSKIKRQPSRVTIPFTGATNFSSRAIRCQRPEERFSLFSVSARQAPVRCLSAGPEPSLNSLAWVILQIAVRIAMGSFKFSSNQFANRSDFSPLEPPTRPEIETAICVASCC